LSAQPKAVTHNKRKKTGEFFKTRADAVQDVPRLVDFFERFGLFVDVKLPGQKKSKSVLLYHRLRGLPTATTAPSTVKTFQTYMLVTARASMSSLRPSTLAACCTPTARTTLT
jgi:hypothetical protein